MDKGGQSQGVRGKEGPVEPLRPLAASSPVPPPPPSPVRSWAKLEGIDRPPPPRPRGPLRTFQALQRPERPSAPPPLVPMPPGNRRYPCRIILSQPESRRFPFSDLGERVFRFSDICIENGVSSGFEKWYQAAVLGRLSIYPP
ncbi:neural Wiskott-Aldrich syndrome protein-like [Felis catus]|uniref:neural Wiskott-Aldrich syndrome protein-like n=1 Tax=Felis catus TaxID=9685 RepID=UPI001D19AFBA|nr:neural Wiskott-Aldrich syndrome protein-like [Felis catus]